MREQIDHPKSIASVAEGRAYAGGIYVAIGAFIAGMVSGVMLSLLA
jgi:hypothetical protein